MKLLFTLALALLAVTLATQAQALDVLGSVNQRRASIGRVAFRHDPGLYRAAQAEADAMARQGRMGHVYGSKSIKRYTSRYRSFAAGVGAGSRSDIRGTRFNSCYASTRSYSYAGAATATRGGRTYYALMLGK